MKRWRYAGKGHWHTPSDWRRRDQCWTLSTVWLAASFDKLYSSPTLELSPLGRAFPFLYRKHNAWWMLEPAEFTALDRRILVLGRKSLVGGIYYPFVYLFCVHSWAHHGTPVEVRVGFLLHVGSRDQTRVIRLVSK